MSDQPHDLDARLRRLLGDAEPGDDALLADPEMLRLISVLDEIDPDDRLEAPPAHLWDAIATGAGIIDHAATAPPPTGGGVGGTGRGGADEAAAAPVVPLRRSSGPPWWLGAAAAVLVVLVVAVGALAIATGNGSEEELAAAELDVLVDAEARGAARLVRVPDNDDLVLVLDVDGLDPIDGYYEVWLLTPEVDGLISLGPLRADGRYEVPAGLDPRFSVVDVSIEPHDGDPTHSGNSILRGGLVEA